MIPDNQDLLGRIAGIRKSIVKAIFADDSLLERLALKGGGALELIYGFTKRASVDLDFSMAGEFDEGVEAARERLERALAAYFLEQNLQAFDVRLSERPPKISQDVRDFWGGYALEFKLIPLRLFKELKGDETGLRRNALIVSPALKGKVEIDISKFESFSGVREETVENLFIKVYTPEAMIFEKLRAICQQMPEYAQIVHRSRPGSPRPQDFYDIDVIRMHGISSDLLGEENLALLKDIFQAKRVPLRLLTKVAQSGSFHGKSWQRVIDTVPEKESIKPFDHYLCNTASLSMELAKALGIADSPTL